MKSDSGDFTHRKHATDPGCFRALATGSGYTPGVGFDTRANAIEMTGERRKARVIATAGPRSTIPMAPSDEGFANSQYDESEDGTERTWR